MRGLFFIVNTKDTFDLELARKAILGGADGIQWRHKGSFSKEFMDFGFALKKLCRESKITFLVNDRPDIALILDADGVHLGQTDLPIEAGRKILGEKKLIGATASTLPEAKKAFQEGADYISMGHIFTTKSKEKAYPPIGTESLIQIVKEIPLPIFAIGGITRQNAGEVMKTGVAGIAVISAISESEDPCEETKKIKALFPEENDRYSQQIALPEIGIAGQKKLKAASVLVIGAGGLGCPALQYLAASGIGKVGIVDPDRVELSNLHRQILYGTKDIGKLKCEVAAEKLSRLNPECILDPLPFLLGNENALSLIRGYDLVVDGTDNFSARYAIDDACMQLKKPWIFASVAGFTGQLALFDRASFKDLYPYPPSEERNCANAGVIGALPGVLGSMQALEAVKILSGMGSSLLDTLVVLDGRTWKLSQYQMKEASLSLEISYEKMLQLKNVQLIDIRRFNLRNLPKDKTIVLYCQKGIRSKILASELRRDLGRMDIYSLAINPFT